MRGVSKAHADRNERDFYATPDRLAYEIVARIDPLCLPVPSRVLDPCAGAGVFQNAAILRWPGATVDAVDLSPGPGIVQADFLRYENAEPYDLIVGNPPYLLAEEFVRHALTLVREGGRVAYLLRVSFIGGQRRAVLYGEHPLRMLFPIIPRPGFTPDGKTDASEYALFVWERGFNGVGEIRPAIRWQR